MTYRGQSLGLLLLLGFGSSACGGSTASSTEAPARPAETMTGAAYAGGTRLRAVLAEASDGTASFFHWWDSELRVTCRFERVDEPGASWRCMPTSAPVIYEGAELFADAGCTAPLVSATALPAGGPRIVARVDTQCGVARDYFRPISPFDYDVVHRKTETGCVPETRADDLLALERLPASAFVAARVAAAPATGSVALGRLEAEDGARAPHGFRDVADGFDCWPRETVEGLRCLPTDFGWDRGGLFADARCSAPAVVPERSCGRELTELPFVLSADRTAPDDVSAVHRGGARLKQSFLLQGVGECSAGNPETTAFAVGERLELGSFERATVSKAARPSGLVQTVAEVGAVSVARFDELSASALGGYACRLAATAAGAVRCIPPLDVRSREYSDPGCTQPVWGTDYDVVSVGDYLDQVEVLAEGPVVLPSVERVLVGATLYDGPVYAQNGTECTLRPGVPNARQPYRRFSGEANLSELPALSVVVR